MTKVIIQHGKYRGLYQIVLLQCKQFFLIKWWKTISISEHFEEEAVTTLAQLIRKYNIEPCSVYDWSGDGFEEVMLKNAV